LVAGQEVEQQDPCQAKSKVVADVTYCDRYWECLTGERELYDCPNGLVWVGKNRGIADGCDYPWRNPTICRGKDLASEYSLRDDPNGCGAKSFGTFSFNDILKRLCVDNRELKTFM